MIECLCEDSCTQYCVCVCSGLWWCCVKWKLVVDVDLCEGLSGPCTPLWALDDVQCLISHDASVPTPETGRVSFLLRWEWYPRARNSLSLSVIGLHVFQFCQQVSVTGHHPRLPPELYTAHWVLMGAVDLTLHMFIIFTIIILNTPHTSHDPCL